MRANYNITDDPSSIKHGFILSFYYLLKATKEVERTGIDEMNEQFYYDAIKDTISIGGDTASNAAIVGGILGAIVGIKRGIPQQMLHSLLRYDYEISPGETCYDVVKEEILSMKKYGVHLTR